MGLDSLSDDAHQISLATTLSSGLESYDLEILCFDRARCFDQIILPMVSDLRYLIMRHGSPVTDVGIRGQWSERYTGVSQCGVAVESPFSPAPSDFSNT